MTDPTPPPVLCEVLAPTPDHRTVLSEVAHACARDLGQALAIVQLTPRRVASTQRPPEPTLTLHLPAELAGSQHQVWCLACRLACFCPSARVSVLVLGAFNESEKASPTLQSA